MADAKTFTGKTMEFAVKAKLNTATIKWFVDGNVEDYSDVAIGAESGAEAVVNFAKPLISGGQIKENVPGDTIAVKKFWVMCRDQYEIDRKPNTGTASDLEAVIPLHEELTIKATWTARHKYELPDAQLLIGTLLGKLWRECTASPPGISVWLAERLRTRSNINPTVGSRLAIVPGKTAVAEEVILDTVDVSFELFMRI